MTKGTLFAILLTASATVVAEVSPHAPAQIIPASEKAASVAVAPTGRARTPATPSTPSAASAPR